MPWYPYFPTPLASYHCFDISLVPNILLQHSPHWQKQQLLKRYQHCHIFRIWTHSSPKLNHENVYVLVEFRNTTCWFWWSPFLQIVISDHYTIDVQVIIPHNAPVNKHFCAVDSQSRGCQVQISVAPPAWKLWRSLSIITNKSCSGSIGIENRNTLCFSPDVPSPFGKQDPLLTACCHKLPNT